MTTYELYDQQVKPLPLGDKLQLVHWILDDIGGATVEQKAGTGARSSSVLVEYQIDGKTPYEHLKEIAALPVEATDVSDIHHDNAARLYLALSSSMAPSHKSST